MQCTCHTYACVCVCVCVGIICVCVCVWVWVWVCAYVHVCEDKIYRFKSWEKLATAAYSLSPCEKFTAIDLYI